MSRSDYIKYPSTPYLDYSPTADEDDIILDDDIFFKGTEVVVTEKRDGENANLYRDHYHARSVDSRHHPSRNWAKNLHGEVCHMIPEGWRVCGENMYAEHTIKYDNLETYFEVFSVWNENNVCLSWDQTVEWCDLLGIKHVPVLWRGEYNRRKIQDLAEELDNKTKEGLVVRNAGSYHYDDFQSNIAKWVNEDFKQKLLDSDEHWMHKQIQPNELKEDTNNE